MTFLAMWRALGPMSRIIASIAVLAIVFGVMWWAAGAPRVELAKAKKDLSEIQSAHSLLLTRLQEAESAVSSKTQEVRSAYDAGIRASAQMREKEISDAYQRGKSATAGISSGAISVRTVWRERDCPTPNEREGTEPDSRSAGVSWGRAEAIGNLLGEGGVWDATYAEAYRRLESAQKIVNACFEEPAK